MRLIALLGILLACMSLPVNAQTLDVPLTGHRVRPIEARSLFHTLDSDFFVQPDGTTYVQTGDIPAMWLRDAASQTLPYVRFSDLEPGLARQFRGVIAREATDITIDPYANAFTAQNMVWERKWEIDSLAWPVILAWVYHRQTNDVSIFTPKLHEAFRKIVATYRCEQRHATCSRYRWPHATTTVDTFNPYTGLIWSAFRPSDDPVRYRFNIPQNMFAIVALGDLSIMARDNYHDAALANDAAALAVDVEYGILQYATVYTDATHRIYAYETDGYGNYRFIDDANIPNLTTLPYIGWCSAYDPTYLATRSRILSVANPYYYSGKFAMGLGSPHTPPDWIWPLGIIGRALTATSSAEVDESLSELAETDSEGGLIHESFYDNGYWKFTRADFGWANALYAELIFRSVAGMSATPFTPGSTVIAGEPISATPTLVPLLVQLENQGRIYEALHAVMTHA